MVSAVFAVAAPAIVMFGGIRPYGSIEKKVDVGTFAITVGGRRAGRETFEVAGMGRGMRTCGVSNGHVLATAGNKQHQHAETQRAPIQTMKRASWY